MRFVEIDGKRYAWKDILQKRREQLTQSRQPQPTLFELKEDARPPSARAPLPGGIWNRRSLTEISYERRENPGAE
jgi:hypothetical protein